jgi:hypothetical protein
MAKPFPLSWLPYGYHAKSLSSVVLAAICRRPPARFRFPTGCCVQPCQGWGRGFESPRPLQNSNENHDYITGTATRGPSRLSMVNTWSTPHATICSRSLGRPRGPRPRLGLRHSYDVRLAPSAAYLYAGLRRPRPHLRSMRGLLAPLAHTQHVPKNAIDIDYLATFFQSLCRAAMADASPAIRKTSRTAA